MPALESADQCYGIQLRTQSKAAINSKNDNRISKYKNLYQQLKRRGVTDFGRIYRHFSADEIMYFNATIGLQWREIAKQAISAINEEELQLEESRSFLENLKEKKHDCYATSPGNLERGVEWLEFMLT